MAERDAESPITATVERARGLLDGLPDDLSDPETLLVVVERLGQVRDLLDEALNESMAEATLAGASIRKVALVAGLSPNAVPPRLARTSRLAPYSSAGSVSSPSIERARYDADLGRPPDEAIPASKPRMTFQRRRSSQ